MNNVIPLRRDPLRNLFETIDQYNDTEQSPEQKRITDEALALVQKMIEAKSANSEKVPTKLSDGVREIRQLIDKQGGYNFEALKREQDYGEDDLPVA